MRKNNRRLSRDVEGSERAKVTIALYARSQPFKAVKELGHDVIMGGNTRVRILIASLYANPNRRQTEWRFNLGNLNREDSGQSVDVLVLRCLSYPACHFVIPADRIPNHVKRISITSINPREYQGQWHSFREAWGWIDLHVDNPP